MRQYKGLVAFPLLATVIIALISAAIWIPVYYVTGIYEGRVDHIFLLVIFFVIVFFLSYFVIYFMDAALVHYFAAKLDDESPGVFGSIAYALHHTGKIFVWASMCGSVGLVLRGLAKLVGLPYFLAKRALGRLTGNKIGVAWHSMISLGVPLMVFESTGVRQAIQMSGDMARETWGDDISNARASLSWIFWTVAVIALIPFILALLLESPVVTVVAASVVLDIWLMLGAICSSMNNMFAVSLYHYVSRGEMPPFYSRELIEDPFKRKGSRQQAESGDANA